jgi:hypothetical protein
VSPRQAWSPPVAGGGGWGPTSLQVEACHWGNLAGLWSMGLVYLSGAAWRRSCGPVECQLSRSEGHGPAEMVQAYVGLRVAVPEEIVHACGSLAWQTWGVWAWRVGVWVRSGRTVEHCPGGAEERGQRIRDPKACHGPMRWGFVCSAGCSFNKLWHRGAFHELGVQSAKVLALPVLYLSQVCLQRLSKVPGSWSSPGLQLCPSRHLRSSFQNIF